MKDRWESKEGAAVVSGTAGSGGCLAISVWLVDDRSDLRALLRKLLHGHEELRCEREFSSAESLLEVLRKETPPRVILMDNNMNGMSGLEAIQPVKKLAPGSHVFLLTTFFDTHVKNQAIRLGASGFLLKSYSIGTIAERITEAVRFGRAVDSNEPTELAYEPGPKVKKAQPSLGDRLGSWLRYATRFEDAVRAP